MTAVELAHHLVALYNEKYGDAKRSALVIHGASAEFEASFDELCAAYLDASPLECEQIRQVIATNRILQGAFLGNAIRAKRQIQKSDDIHWLRWALASVSI